MSLKDVSKWNKRMSIVYAVGVWGMIGSYAVFKYMGRYDDNPGEMHLGACILANSRNKMIKNDQQAVVFIHSFFTCGSLYLVRTFERKLVVR